MLQGRDNEYLKHRRGGLMPGRVTTRIAHFHVRGLSFGTLGAAGTEDKLTALGYRREHGGEVKLVWAEK